MKKTLLLLALFFCGLYSFAQTLSQPGQFNYVCDSNNDGHAVFLLTEIGLEISGNNPNLVVTHHETQTDAATGANPLPSPYINIVAHTQTIYARVVNNLSGEIQNYVYALNVLPTPTASPYSTTVCDTNGTGYANINLNSYIPQFTQGNPNINVSFHLTAVDAGYGANPLSSPYVNTTSGTQTFYVRVEGMTTSCFTVTELHIQIISCQGQPGVPNNLTACVDPPNLACFDLSVNTPPVLGSSNPANYSVSYYPSMASASSGNTAAALPDNFCPPSSPYTVFVRFAANDGSMSNVTSFTLTSRTVETGAMGSLQNMVQCDDNADGVIIYNLTNAQAQIVSGNVLNYYTTSNDAQNMTNPIMNATAYATPASAGMLQVFVREMVVGGCDRIYGFSLQNLPNCNMAATCTGANSLCGALNTPFANTVGIVDTGTMQCLQTTPNPTWFYMPVSSPGTIQVTILQNTNTGNQIDVDYILYGPFLNPATPCGNPALLNAGSMVSCSYSPAAVENFTIVNALPGQYYLLLVTNFSNQAGMITITQTNQGAPGSGALDCSGFRLQAFLDANANGTKDNNEVNFPLGQFHYEKNNNGVVHHASSPNGTYEIYEVSSQNTYNASFSINAQYAAMYALTTSSYSNLVSSAGMATYNFPVTTVQPYNDLSVSVVSLNAPRPGFTYQNKIVYKNSGNQTISGTLGFTHDSHLAITANTQSWTVPMPNGFTYAFTNLAPYETRTMTVTMQIPTIPTVTAGDYLTNTISIEPVAGDLVLENNSNTCSDMIINAYDPNDKMESHGEKILHSTFTANDYLYYTIRFENTGNASAINVRVLDILDSQLDLGSMQMVSASHTYQLDRVANGLTWTFNNIQLPVSVSNTMIGKGYITFKIKPKPGYAVGDIIRNAASIYFDFNPAIVTNTFETEFVSALAVNQFDQADFVMYPNPASDHLTVAMANNGQSIAAIRVYDVLGKNVLLEKASAPVQTVDVSGLTSGIYFMEVTTADQIKVVKKLMVK